MIPREFSFLTPEALGHHYATVCAAAGLEPTPSGWGLLHCTDHGKRVTAVTSDVAYLRLMVTGIGSEALRSLTIPAAKFPSVRDGWPDDWVSTS